MRRQTTFLIIYLLFLTFSAHATQVLPMNANQIVGTADLICNCTFLQATAIEVADPDTGEALPATRFEFKVHEMFKGNVEGEVLSFVQFGLSRRKATTLRKLYVHGTPNFEPGKEYVICLTREAPGTGFRSLVGLGQGKFRVEQETGGAKSLVNDFNNADLFKNVTPTKGMATKSLPSRGPVSFDDFKTLIRERTRK